MSVEYAWRGLVGVLTPQGNTTAEPELAILFPPGIATITARMVSMAPALNDRLRDYFSTLDATVDQFENAPLGVIAVACTGASYLVSRSAEQKLVGDLARRRGVPVVTSGQAVIDALGALEARRIGLVSPYPPELTAASVRYWEAAGLEVAHVVEMAPEPQAFHRIYAMSADSARAALDRLDGVPGLDAVVMLGTGLPTLRPILEKPRAAGAPVLSCVLVTAWRAMLALEDRPPDRAGLLAWIDSPEWAPRLPVRQKAGSKTPAA